MRKRHVYFSWRDLRFVKVRCRHEGFRDILENDNFLRLVVFLSLRYVGVLPVPLDDTGARLSCVVQT